MADDLKVRDGYPQPVDNQGRNEGSEGNPGVPGDYLDDVLKDFDKKANS
jgi:hypothetical protein